MEKNTIAIPEETILQKILQIRGSKVMIDSDLAELYGVTTKRLNEQVKRNLKRFPIDFMFQLTESEKNEVVANCDHLKKLKFSPYLPYAFTEHGAVMLASVLNSERAIIVNMHIIRIFNKMREMLILHKDVLVEIANLKSQISGHEEKILRVFEYLRQLQEVNQNKLRFENRPRIGYKQGKSK